MKKQILFLTFLMLAVFAGTIKSYAQEVDHLDAAPAFCPTPITLTCSGDNALSPVAGQSYDYTITSSSVGTLHWFVTDDASVMTAEGTLTTTRDPGDGTGDYILTSDAVYNNNANTSLTISLTWKSFDATANQVLLVAYNVNEALCTDNIEVYRIRPSYSFTLDIAGILDNGTSGAEECVAPVQSASYDGTNLNVQYGTNYVFFAVNAANWQTSWLPNFSATTDGGSTLGALQWAYPNDATTGGAWNDASVAVTATSYASNNNGFIGSAGECIIVRVPVDHGVTTENISDETINLVVNGEMINPETTAYDGVYPDLENADADNDGKCDSDLTSDNANYVITARPDINESDPSPFENKVPRD